MAAFEEGKELVVYCYDIKEKFIEDVFKMKFEGKRVVKTGLNEIDVHDICKRRGLSAKIIKIE